MQDRFAVRLNKKKKRIGIHTALDTNGSLGSRLTEDDLEQVDLVLLDIKAWDKDNHQRMTGYNITPVQDFAKGLAELRKPVWIRFVLVPGYTDNPEEVSMIAKFASDLGNVERVDVLPFHQMGRFKWKELHLNYSLEMVEPPSIEEVERFCSIFRAAGLSTY